jgi:DMSO/TMAO reductase YedYZ molybdopterin-dependent catalytic subunit
VRFDLGAAEERNMDTRLTGSDATSVSAGAGRPLVPPGRTSEPAYAGRLSRYGKRADLILHEEEPFNAETGPAALAESPVTATEAFYVRGHGAVPTPDPAGWRLKVDGLVERELKLSLGTLRQVFREHEVTATLQCAGNRRAGLVAIRDIPGEAPWGPGATGTATWTGIALADVLALAGVLPDATHVGFVGADLCGPMQPPERFAGSIPLDKACRPEVLLAWGMNGESLPLVHGAPLRVVVPGYIGARSVKWLEQIEIRSAPSRGTLRGSTSRSMAARTGRRRSCSRIKAGGPGGNGGPCSPSRLESTRSWSAPGTPPRPRSRRMRRRFGTPRAT